MCSVGRFFGYDGRGKPPALVSVLKGLRGMFTRVGLDPWPNHPTDHTKMIFCSTFFGAFM